MRLAGKPGRAAGRVDLLRAITYISVTDHSISIHRRRGCAPMTGDAQRSKPDAAPPPGPFRAGDEPIAGYRLIEPLGKGGFGEVWKCQAPGGFLKAIKFVLGATATGDDNQGFLAEQELRSLQLIKNIRHPFILTVERAELQGDTLMIIMELAERSLGDALLEYTRRDDRGGPCIRPRYRAPELLQHRISRRSDQYSLAIVYQELLTGEVPFKGRTGWQLFLQHQQAHPDLSALPEADRDAVARALAKDPEERFASCRDFVRALGQPVPSGTKTRADLNLSADAEPRTDPALNLKPTGKASLEGLQY